MKKDFATVSRRSFIAASALGLAGCASSSSDSGSTSGSASTDDSSSSDSSMVLKVCAGGEPDTLDPALMSDTTSGHLASQLFATLYQYDEDGSFVPCLADGDPEVSDDGCTYTIHMIESKWSDGSDLTANDFVYSWNRSIADETAADYAYLFDIVARNDDDTLAVTADDDYTLSITLTNPCPYFQNLLMMGVYLPVPEDEVTAADTDGTNPGAWCQEAGFKCNGPFTVSEWTHDESMVLVKNENFYDADSIMLDSIEYMLSDDDTAIFAAYENGDIDFTDVVPTDEVQSVIDNDDFYIIDSPGTYYLAFNVNSDFFEGMTEQEAKDFRHAICLLIDRQYIVDNVGQTGQQVADSLVCPGVSDGNGEEFKGEDDSYYDASEDAVDSNREEAMELLAGLGYTFTDNGDGTYSCEPSISLPYIINEGTGHQAVAECLQQDLAMVGIDMTVETQDWNVFLENRKNGNFTFAREGWQLDYDDASNFLEIFISDGGNNDPQLGVEPVEDWAPSNWDEYDAMVEEIRTSTDFAARAELMHEAEAMLMDTWAVIPIYYYNDVYMAKDSVDNILLTPSGGKIFWYTTVEE